MPGGYAYVTLATNDTYSLGALVLAHSLKRVNTTHNLVVLITPSVSTSMKQLLGNIYNEIVEVDILDSKDEENLRLLKRPELGVTFTKLHCWKLINYDKCVFLDADTLVLQNCDELFEREELSAAPDIGWPDCFNSGVFVYKPSLETYKNLIQFAVQHGSFDGGDQGLLNMYFSNWLTADIRKHLPFIYNLCSAALYSYLPAFKWFGHNIKIVHFISGSKPWLQSFNPQTRTVQAPIDSPHLKNLLQLWWDIFCVDVHPGLSTEMSGIAETYATIKLDHPPSEEQLLLEDQFRRQNWEQGNIDYMGKDAFDNIWARIQKTISSDSSDEQKPSAEVDKIDKDDNVEKKADTDQTMRTIPSDKEYIIPTTVMASEFPTSEQMDVKDEQPSDEFEADKRSLDDKRLNGSSAAAELIEQKQQKNSLEYEETAELLKRSDIPEKSELESSSSAKKVVPAIETEKTSTLVISSESKSSEPVPPIVDSLLPEKTLESKPLLPITTEQPSTDKSLPSEEPAAIVAASVEKNASSEKVQPLSLSAPSAKEKPVGIIPTPPPTESSAPSSECSVVKPFNKETVITTPATVKQIKSPFTLESAAATTKQSVPPSEEQKVATSSAKSGTQQQSQASQQSIGKAKESAKSKESTSGGGKSSAPAKKK